MMRIAPAQALAHVDPNYFDTLPDAEALAAVFDLGLWLRPEQQIPRGDWRSWGVIAGRGYGKTLAIAHEINRRVEAGEARSVGLMAPTEDRVAEVQVRTLVDLSPPWFRAEPYGGGVRWPSGVIAECHTAVAPSSPRSSNFDLVWMTEIVAWPRTTRREAFDNMTTACRVGRAQYIWDTTSKGKNDVIQLLQKQAQDRPDEHILIRGSMYDNPMLSRTYLRDEIAKYVIGSQRYHEEVEGLVFAESAGALWKQAWIDDGRRDTTPLTPEIILVSLDPSMSDGPDADEAGAAVLARTRDRHMHVLADFSGRQKPEAWATTAVDWCESRGAAGVLYERNHCGDMPRDMIKLIAEARGIRIEVLTNDKQPFPARRPGTIFIRSITSRNEKGERAEAPAKLYKIGQVHHVGTFEELEHEMTTWEQGSKSPNRLDACVQGIAELAGLREATTPTNAAKEAAAADRLQSALRALPARRGRLGI